MKCFFGAGGGGRYADCRQLHARVSVNSPPDYLLPQCKALLLPFRPPNCKKNKTTKTVVLFFGAGGGGRTRTLSPGPDFESGTSANSITPAYFKGIVIIVTMPFGAGDRT